MNSRGFYSFYVFVLIAFIALAVMRYLSGFGRENEEKIQDHLLMQMEIFSHDLLDLGKVCVKKHSSSQCQFLAFDLKGYKLQFSMQGCEENICIVDAIVERTSPISSLPLRYARREIWNLKNLSKNP